jgi:hypothetical protein
MTTLASIRRFVRQLYPPGIWIKEDTLMDLMPWDTIRKIELTRLGWNAIAARHFGAALYACPLLIASRIAEIEGCPVDYPAALVHRGTKIERHVGTAVI